MNKSIFAALMAAGLAAAMLPAEAGGRHRQQCGWYQGRWCCRVVEVEIFHRRVYEGTFLVPRGTLLVPRDGGEPIFIPRGGPPIFVPTD